MDEQLERVRALRTKGEPSIPSTIAEEKLTNPFVREANPELQASVRARYPDLDDDPVAIFAKTRELKDSF